MPIAPDKRGHFLAGIAITCIAYVLGGLVGVLDTYGPYWTLGTALGVGVTSGVVKEVHDAFNRHKNTPEVWDALATVLGSVFAAGCILLLIWGSR